MVINKKYQVTIPKEVIEKIKLKAGDIVEIEAVDNSTIVIKRKISEDALKLLIGEKPAFGHHIPVEDIENAAEEALH